MLEFYDSLFRYWAVGLFVLIGVIAVRDHGLKLQPVLAALSSWSAACYLVGAQPPGFSAFGWAGEPFILMSSMAPAFIWLFSLSQFDDHFKLTKIHYGLFGLYVWLFFIRISHFVGVDLPIPDKLADFMLPIFRISLLLHMVFVAWQGREDDLLEKRRRFRTVYIVLVTGFTATVTVIETWFRDIENVSEILLFQAVSFTALGMVLAWFCLKFDSGTILVSAPAAPSKTKKKSTPDPVDAHDLQQITDLVVGKKVYLEPGLTVASLAEKIGLPEHRLRRLVNQHMGYRNFADFLNEYRIAAAREKLSDIQNRNEQILVIAMDLGYGSLGPFNRAFKERTGLTPSEFRKKALAESEK